jgi:hypothetical protein
MRAVLVVLLGMGLAGCQTAEMKAAEQAANDQTCQSYGAKPGSDIYIQCRLQMDSLNQQRRIARSQQLAAISAQMNAASQPQNVSCTRTLTGGMDCHRW